MGEEGTMKEDVETTSLVKEENQRNIQTQVFLEKKRGIQNNLYNDQMSRRSTSWASGNGLTLFLAKKKEGNHGAQDRRKSERTEG